MFSKVNTFGISGVRGFCISAEANITKGIPCFDVVGLGSEAVRESRKRVKAAIENQGYNFPLGRITLNLAHADTKKQGTALDLPIALSILSASGAVHCEKSENFGVIGELSLNGQVRGVRGVVPMIYLGIKENVRRFIVPRENLHEIAPDFYGDDVEIFPVSTLREAAEAFCGKSKCFEFAMEEHDGEKVNVEADDEEVCDFGDIVGQNAAKRALEIAVSGNHNILLIGAVGCGKTLMAKAARDIMVPLSKEEAFETSMIYSIAGIKRNGSFLTRPFRCVHSNVTRAALTGGGRPFELGEISLAHNGILFIDEMSEISGYVTDSLRQPLEEKYARVNNCGLKEIVPANFMLIGATNPCPCGNLYEAKGQCTCSPQLIKKFGGRLSAPVMDRIDIQIPVKRIQVSQLREKSNETSVDIRKRVLKTREIQAERYKKERFNTNGELTRNCISRYCPISASSKRILERAVETMGISFRGYEKVIKVARTIADMEARENIEDEDVCEALQYRIFERRENAA